MGTNVISYLEQACEQDPDRVALSDRSRRLTYRQAWDYVSAAGSEISDRLGGRNLPVAIGIRHDVTDVLNFFAVAYSGNFYVPVDLKLPLPRVRAMLETVAPSAVIVRDPRERDRLPPTDGGWEVWLQEELPGAGAGEAAPWREGKDTDPLYVLFTSGSTGEPKGVVISHRSVIDMAEQFSAVFRFPEHSVFGNQAPFDFDVSVKDIFLSLKTGGTLEILEKKLFSFPKFLIQRLNQRRVDTLIWAVPALKIISAVNAFQNEKPQFLKTVLFSGEVMPPKTLNYWRGALPGVRYVNLYGPTEITCNCNYYILPDGFDPEGDVPIGGAFPNCSVFLLDGDRPVTEEGEIGELCVTGSCLALGYYNRPELTAAAFPQNPLRGAWHERMYRTGDLGCCRGGLLYFMGRRDTQIKHMGHRVELSEIELRANAVPGVAVSACVYDEAGARIALFYQGEAEEGALRARLQKQLPRYMLPGRVIPVERFPQTRTGKIDRRALLAGLKGEESDG